MNSEAAPIKVGKYRHYRLSMHTSLAMQSEFWAWLCWLELAPLWSEPFGSVPLPFHGRANPLDSVPWCRRESFHI